MNDNKCPEMNEYPNCRDCELGTVRCSKVNDYMVSIGITSGDLKEMCQTVKWEVCHYYLGLELGKLGFGGEVVVSIPDAESKDIGGD